MATMSFQKMMTINGVVHHHVMKCLQHTTKIIMNAFVNLAMKR